MVCAFLRDPSIMVPKRMHIGFFSAELVQFTSTAVPPAPGLVSVLTLPPQAVAHTWRTSTPEPVKGDGIIWTLAYLKNVTRFVPLFSKSGTFIVQLDILIKPKIDGEYASYTISEHQLAGGSYHLAPTGHSGSNGTSNNTFCYVNTAGYTYTRQVHASSNVIAFDHQGGNLAPSPVPDQSSRVLPVQTFTKARLPGVG
ncbi:hypothetical protein BJV78DRAFT_1278358 [Lactifluus subvellereus]|nr:hypothetical protein BJV78DRAFT_1278358 [Lactifluus subvellereus]